MVRRNHVVLHVEEKSRFCVFRVLLVIKRHEKVVVLFVHHILFHLKFVFDFFGVVVVIDFIHHFLWKILYFIDIVDVADMVNVVEIADIVDIIDVTDIVHFIQITEIREIVDHIVSPDLHIVFENLVFLELFLSVETIA